MCNSYFRRQTGGVSGEDRRFWAPILISLAVAVLFLAVSMIWALWIVNKISFYTVIYPVTVLVIGFISLGWGICWYRNSRPGAQLPRDNQTCNDGTTIEVHDDIQHEVRPDRDGMHFMGERLGFSIKLKNLLNTNCTRDFWYAIQLPDGMLLLRPSGSIQFSPNETKIIRLDPDMFLGFVGIVRVVVITGQAATVLAKTGNLPQPYTFLTLFVTYARDREGYNLQKNMLRLTSKIQWLTIILVILTIVLVIFTIIQLKTSSTISQVNLVNISTYLPVTLPHAS